MHRQRSAKGRALGRVSAAHGGVAPALVALAILAGCVSIKEGTPAREWSKTMREMQIVAVFPPREGVQPGDLYLLSSDQPGARAEAEAAAKSGFLPIGTWVGRIDLRKQMREQYQSDVSFPLTPTTTNVDGAQHQDQLYLPMPTRPDLFGLPTGNQPTGDTDRPRLVGFPEFAAATFSEGDLSALVPVEALNIAGAAGFNASKRVTLSIPVAEYYGLPAPVALDALLGTGTVLRDQAGQPGLSVAQLKTLLGTRDWTVDSDEPVAVFRYITEVYMTRVVDIGVHGEQSRGVNLKVKPALPVPSAGAVPADGSGAPPADEPVDSSGEDADPVALANQLNSQLDSSLSGLETPGGSLRFVSAGTSSVSMRRVFERPVAIGYRAIQLYVSVKMVDSKPELYISKTLQMPSDPAGGAWIPTGGAELEPAEGEDEPSTSGPETDIQFGQPTPPSS